MLYSIPILFLKRFHNSNNIFTVNICLTITLCSLYYLIYFIIFLHIKPIFINKSICLIIEYFRLMLTCQIGYSFLTVSIYRYTVVIYHWKIFFKKKNWITICIVCQWINGMLLPIPIWSSEQPKCFLSHFANIYSLIIVIFIPLIIYLYVNIRLLCYVYQSIRRVAPQPVSLHITLSENPRENTRHHGIRLLLHTICMFFSYILGWIPFYSAMFFRSITWSRKYIYTILIIWGLISLYAILISLFIYNRKIRKFLKNKFCPCC